jgi:hypothetical protein
MATFQAFVTLSAAVLPADVADQRVRRDRLGRAA